MDLYTGSFRIYKKQGDTFSVALCPGRARADEELSGAVAMEYQALTALNRIMAVPAAGRHPDIVQLVAGLALCLREGDNEIALGDLRGNLLRQRPVSSARECRTGKHDRGKKRFKRKPPADRFHHDHGLDRPAIDTAHGLVERQRGETEFGEVAPHGAAPTPWLFLIGPAALEVAIAVRNQAVDALL